ncbi:MAG: hypothetical protein ACFCGT_07075 [Sandaracinaceae bacterium]
MRTLDLVVEPTSVTLGMTPLRRAGPVADFYAMLGPASRVLSAGGRPPIGHRNTQIHVYDELGATLMEHHYTHQVHCVGAVLNRGDDAIHSTARPFAGALWVGGVRLGPGALESELRAGALPFTSRQPGYWRAEVTSVDGDPILVTIATMGRRPSSGRRSRRREILGVQLSLAHDPWDTTHRPPD